MLWTQLGNVTITVHNTAPVSSSTWESYLAWCADRKRDLEAGQRDLRSLIYTSGGAPTAVQRSQYVQVVGQAPIPVAICSPSMAMRALAKAIAWFTKQRFAVFHLDEIEAALDYLGIDDPARRQAISETTMGMFARLHLGGR